MLPIYRSKFSVFNYEDIPAGYYHQVMQNGHPIQQFWHRQKFANVAERVPDQALVLDLGCGPGSFLSILGQVKPQIKAIGVDVASRQIEFANREIASLFTSQRISFTALTDPELKLPFENESFDVVTCIEVIEHIHPYFSLKLVEEAKRVLRPEGKLIVTTPNYRSFWPFIEKALELMSPVKYHEQHINQYTPNSLTKFLESGGWEVEKLESIFIVAPFLNVLSSQLAKRCFQLEKKSGIRLGSLLIAEARKLKLN